jgi:hypothetical protein
MYTDIVRKGTALSMALLVMTVTHWVLPEKTEARQVRNATRTNVNRNVNANRNRDFSRNVDARRSDVDVRRRDVDVRRSDVNVNRNINVNRDIDIDVDHDWHGGWDSHPVATAAAVTAAATVTAAAIGSIVYALPRSCSAVVAGGITYQNCGGTWYQPQYAGTQVTYVVVNPPY